MLQRGKDRYLRAAAGGAGKGLQARGRAGGVRGHRALVQLVPLHGAVARHHQGHSRRVADAVIVSVVGRILDHTAVLIPVHVLGGLADREGGVPLADQHPVLLRGSFHHKGDAVLRRQIAELLPAVRAHLPGHIRPVGHALLESGLEIGPLPRLRRFIRRIAGEFRRIIRDHAPRLRHRRAILVGHDAPVEPPVIGLFKEGAEILRVVAVGNVRIGSSAVLAHLPLVVEISPLRRHAEYRKGSDDDGDIAVLVHARLQGDVRLFVAVGILWLQGNARSHPDGINGHRPQNGRAHPAVVLPCLHHGSHLHARHVGGDLRLIGAAFPKDGGYLVPRFSVLAGLPKIFHRDPLGERGVDYLKLRRLSGHIARRRPQLRLIHVDGGLVGVGLLGRVPVDFAVVVCHHSPIDIAVLLLGHAGNGVVIADPALITVAASDLLKILSAVGAQEPQHRGHILVLHVRGRLVLNGRQGQSLALPSHHSPAAAYIQVRPLRKHIGAEPQRQTVLVLVFVGILHPQPQHPVAPIQPEAEQPLVVLPPMKQPRPQIHRVIFARLRHDL